MKIKKIFKTLLFFSLFSVFSFNMFADTTPEPYNTEEFPQALKDLRRFEIITLGAMPFVMLDVEIGYAAYLSAKNNFDTTYLSGIFGSNSYSEEEQKKIILTSLGISAGIGLVDFTINKIKSSVKSKKNKGKFTGNITVTPLDQDPDATKIYIPEKNLNEEVVPEIDEVEFLDDSIEVIE